MKRYLFILFLGLVAVSISAQPAQRRNQPQRQSPNNTISTRAQISFPTAVPMREDVVWRRDIYRELKLTDDANAGLYYPVEPIGSQMNLFTYIFPLGMYGPLRGGISAYQYRMDGNEVFDDSAKVKMLDFLDNYHIYYERTGKGIRLDKSDIPSAEVKGYYLKESAYYDQGTATFHRKVIALCPIMYRSDDFGDGEVKYPLFWVKYDDLAPFLAKQVIMTSNLNNAATMSGDDYFTMNQYKGKIYKTTNMLGRTLAQYCPTDSAMAAEQKRIENELIEFEKNIFGNEARPDTANNIDSVQKANARTPRQHNRRVRRTESSETTVRAPKRSRNSATSASSSSARISVRRQRH